MQEKRYNTLNDYLRQKFGEKVFKISLDAGFSCPNRDGKISYGGCAFCSPRGSGDFCFDTKDLALQFEKSKQMMRKKWKSGKFIAYFQAYTNTYADVSILREKYESILKLDDVLGIAIATRPDCLPEDVLELLSFLNKKTYLWVELGLQTIHEETSKKMNIGYTKETYNKAVCALKSRGIEVVTHVILGLPKESKDDMLKTVEYVANTGTKGIKLHLLHVVKDTVLCEMYQRGEIELLKKDEYANLIVDCIERLPQDMIVHRITGDGPRNTLVAPLWSIKKWEVINMIDQCFIDRDTFQGKYFIKNE